MAAQDIQQITALYVRVHISKKYSCFFPYKTALPAIQLMQIYEQ